MSGLQEYLGLSGEQLEECLASGDFHMRNYPWLRDIGDELLKYRIEVRQAIPTRLKSAFTWNMNSWKTPKSGREDPKMRRIKKLLKDGPVLLQETKWHHNQEEILLQHISGLQIVSTNAIRTDNAILSGGVAVLLPAGWTIEQKIILMAGRAVAVLINDRCAPFYLVSVYLHPDSVPRELEQIIHAWRNTEKKSDKIVIGGDFNQADIKCPELWKKFLSLFSVVDVHPTLATYLFSGGTSALDRCLVPEDWVGTAKWNPEVRALSSSLVNGHKILKLSVKVRPTVLNNPNDCLHETIPTEAFMPGKNGRLPKDNRALQSLVRLLHRTHKTCFANAIPTDGFRLGASADYLKPVGTYCLPNFTENSTPNQLPPQPALPNGTHGLLIDCEAQDAQIENNPVTGEGANDDYELVLFHNTDPSPACSDGSECNIWADHGCSYAAVSPGNDDLIQDEDPRSHRWDDGLPDALDENVVQLSQISNLHLSISACFWSWWRSLPLEANPAHNKPYLKARKFIHLPAQWVKRYVIEEP